MISKIMDKTYSIPDVIVFSYGTNDTVYSGKNYIFKSYEEIKNLSFKNKNFYTLEGGLSSSILLCKEFFPNARIYVFSPIQSKDSFRNSKNLEKIESIKEICNLLNVNFIDMFNNCKITFETENSENPYLYDGLHPNENGAKEIGECAAYLMKEIKEL